MSVSTQLIAFGLKQVLGEAAEEAIDLLANRFTDHAAALPKALARAHARCGPATLLAAGWRSVRRPVTA
jgi:hypothetical protein